MWEIIHSPKLKIKNKKKISEINLKSSIGLQKLIHLLEPLLTRKKSVRECTCKTSELREEEEEFTTIEPEKVSEKTNGTTDLSRPSVESNGTDYAGRGSILDYLGDDWDEHFKKSRGECNAKTQSWTDPGWCLNKCSKKNKCTDNLTCQKVCLLDKGFKTLSGLQVSQHCKEKFMVPIEGGCLPACKKNSDCIPRIEGLKSNGCKSVCVEKFG